MVDASDPRLGPRTAHVEVPWRLSGSPSRILSLFRSGLSWGPRWYQKDTDLIGIVRLQAASLSAFTLRSTYFYRILIQWNRAGVRDLARCTLKSSFGSFQRQGLWGRSVRKNHPSNRSA